MATWHLTVAGVNGVVYHVTFDGFPTRAAAERRAASYRTDLDNGNLTATIWES